MIFNTVYKSQDRFGRPHLLQCTTSPCNLPPVYSLWMVCLDRRSCTKRGVSEGNCNSLFQGAFLYLVTVDGSLSLLQGHHLELIRKRVSPFKYRVGVDRMPSPDHIERSHRNFEELSKVSLQAVGL